MTAALNVVRLSVNPIFHVLETNPPCCKRAIQRDMVGASLVSRSRRIESPTKAGCLLLEIFVTDDFQLRENSELYTRIGLSSANSNTYHAHSGSNEA